MFILAYLCQTILCVGQPADCGGYVTINFENESCFGNLRIDASDTNNIWVIAEPHKEIFTEANSPLRSIITDSINPYPTNDTSQFIIWAYDEQFETYGWPQGIELSGMYQVRTDAEKDFGRIEFSGDHGQTWYNITDDTSELINDWSGAPTLTGNSNGWASFSYIISYFRDPVSGPSDYDTVMFKFTFISDSIFDGLDGLMYDNLQVSFWAESVEENSRTNLNVYPNPVESTLQIELEKPFVGKLLLEVSDLYGRRVASTWLNPDQRPEINLHHLGSGSYTLSLLNTNGETVGRARFLKQ